MSDDEDGAYFLGTALHDPTGVGGSDDEGPARKKLKQIPVSEQIVTDERGRRRFHGAFTGGFSAGHFNSVGTPEGFTPKSFVSSRSGKKGQGDGGEPAAEFVQKPEDFMDEEDRSEFGIAPQWIRPKGDFDRERQGVSSGQENKGVVPGVEDLFRPIRKHTLGVKLLMKMGWKPGQGIGPRQSKKEKQKEKKRVYTCMMPFSSAKGEEEEDADEDDGLSDVTFAPEDTPTFLVNQKTNTFGLGYVGLGASQHSSGKVNPLLFDPNQGKQFIGGKLEAARSAAKGAVHRRGIRGQAFGVGAFEEDDDDIYSAEDMSNYDFALEPAAPEKAIERPKFRRSRQETLFEVLDGFVSASKDSKAARRHFPAPGLPRGYIPKHKESLLSSLMNRVPQRMEQNQRKEFFGVALTSSTTPVPSSETAPQPPKQLSPAEAAALLDQASKPFHKDPEKQRRYEQYLVLRREGKKQFLRKLQPDRMTEWERENEAHEFERAAVLFKPLSGGIAARFVSSHFSGEEKDRLSHVPATEDNKDKVITTSGKDPGTVEAVRSKMYGRLTRVVRDWYPDKLVCKRFNIADPYPDSEVVGTIRIPSSASERPTMVKEKQEEPNQADVKALMEVTEGEERGVADMVDVTSKAERPEDAAKAGEKEVEQTPADGGRPSLDLFTAIFGESDDEDDTEAVKAYPVTADRKSVDVEAVDKVEVAEVEVKEVSVASSVEAKEDGSSSKPEKEGAEGTQQQPETFLTALRQGILSGIDMEAVQAHWKKKAEELMKKREEKEKAMEKKNSESEAKKRKVLGVVESEEADFGLVKSSKDGQSAPMKFQGFGGRSEKEGPSGRRDSPPLLEKEIAHLDKNLSERVHWLSQGAKRMLDRYLPTDDLKKKKKKEKKDKKEEEEEWVEKTGVDEAWGMGKKAAELWLKKKEKKEKGEKKKRKKKRLKKKSKKERKEKREKSSKKRSKKGNYSSSSSTSSSSSGSDD
ncbi:unnamed protein product [Cyprideis torosa]|uniref:Uncharacterized protein n=1 Tax=Cyprideis torosa TaxID=163714 RepID=A0A7R8WMC8_9CRUS|nr:unnamed protein product [Cyprideis torosa]CAG0902601.1 unnamed protein product [Cyprideis torosa]